MRTSQIASRTNSSFRSEVSPDATGSEAYDPRMISSEHDYEALEEANLLVMEQGVSIEQIAVEALAANLAGVKAARTGDIDSL